MDGTFEDGFEDGFEGRFEDGPGGPFEGMFEGMFDDLTPEAVIGSSAYRIRLRRAREDTDEWFRDFTWECIEATRLALDHAVDHELIPMAIVQRDDEQRLLRPEDSESNRAFTRRVHEDTVQLGWQWLYVAIPSRAVLGETVPHALAGDHPGLVEVVNFCAKRRTDATTRYGLITRTDAGSGAVLFGQDPEGLSPLFAAIG
jgi:hypothetical protein